ncbi:hypothetical protein BATDEDRAFT_90422 [Batrachochytrium dendrobatidis JAM81]|uniref:Uncharacterized protein n=2 Tax=Batrachochytrium dendrobatidis TaxID=109871 RepID=F4P812_BATDJ|nr:uncharacterized protein BATDEDRAFT_90422 [Batrachochytrium dendrobatidis JAM81]EGF78668.1 hypothetical protein BATDEDRAFT_90422 [Batrachochytrium dendrobatidis JAM81]KAK5664877.1 hypothetical protein QVD99_008417 [Batrachochytrium dendrobatidis]OAJ43542.1 hypothetical protein BDEG_26895 [Batrachochytrium dendrobatidis JEL423]|eukprot:XP_006680935.1 hypothetical protein BATDEDRAFT_90422 [Batrachochytrium dendrobatidis JAM81]
MTLCRNLRLVGALVNTTTGVSLVQSTVHMRIHAFSSVSNTSQLNATTQSSWWAGLASWSTKRSDSLHHRHMNRFVLPSEMDQAELELSHMSSGFRILPPLHDFGRLNTYSNLLQQSSAIDDKNPPTHPITTTQHHTLPPSILSKSIFPANTFSRHLPVSNISVTPHAYASGLFNPMTPFETHQHTNHTNGHDSSQFYKSSVSHHKYDLDIFYLNAGKATQVIRDELPYFFEQGLTHPEIYADDIVFTDPHYSHFSSQGIKYYRSVAEFVRMSAKCCFEETSFEIMSIRQVHSSDYNTLTRPNGHSNDDTGGLSDGNSAPDSTFPNHDRPSSPDTATTYLHKELDSSQVRLIVKWSFEGRPRLLNLVNVTKVEYQGVFEYLFDSKGRICEHRLVGIYPAPHILGALKWFRKPAVGVA